MAPASDMTDPDGSETSSEEKDPAAGWPPRRVQSEIRALKRMQFHQRQRMLLLQESMNRIAEALGDRPGLDYPEDLKPVSFLPGERTDVLFLSFGGVRMGSGMPPFEFTASLSSKGVPGYFIKDFRQSWYHEGLLGISEDLEGTHRYLQQLVARHNCKRLVTLGNSAGGYAAILFGALLGADRVTAFAPQVEVTRDVVKQYAAYDSPPPAQFLDKNKAVPALDKFLEGRAGLPRIQVYYAADNRADSRGAARLAGFDRVELRPIAGTANHSIAAELKRSGQLNGILEELITF